MTANANAGLLGDTPRRTYSNKLELFNRFAEPELRRVLADLAFRPGDRVLDAGCGVGWITGWLAERVAPTGVVLGMDLATDHVQEARRASSLFARSLGFLQGDMAKPPFRAEVFDWVWSSNAINHLRDPVAGLITLRDRLRPGGHLVLGQSAFLPDMFFAWDARLEREVTAACYRYYRDKYHLDERDTAGIRSLYAWLLKAGFDRVQVRTYMIERVAPLTEADERYFQECVFQGYWGQRLQPYLSAEDWQELSRLCDPASPAYCLKRPDFHHLQTFTLAWGRK